MRLRTYSLVLILAVFNAMSPLRAEILPSCADQALIENVRNLIVVNNKFPEVTLVQFSEIKTLRSVPPPFYKQRTKQAELACSALVGVSPNGRTDGQVVETVEILYGVAAKDIDTYQVYFQPQRQKK